MYPQVWWSARKAKFLSPWMRTPQLKWTEPLTAGPEFSSLTRERMLGECTRCRHLDMFDSVPAGHHWLSSFASSSHFRYTEAFKDATFSHQKESVKRQNTEGTFARKKAWLLIVLEDMRTRASEVKSVRKGKTFWFGLNNGNMEKM